MDKFPLNNIDRIYDYGTCIMIFSVLVLVIYFAQRKVRNYMANREKLKSMAEKYERKRESRNELKFHYYWALDRGEPSRANSIGREILEMDKELKELYAQYQFYKEKGFFPLKNI